MIPLIRKPLLVLSLLALVFMVGGCAVASGPMVRPAAPAPAPATFR